MNSEISQQTGSPYQNSLAQGTQAPVLSVKDWIIILIIGAIPVVNIVMLFVWAFGGNANPNKKNYSKAALIIAAILIVIYIIFLILFFVVLGVGANSGVFDQLGTTN
jgi:heme/copper-type cytochrome/quinol oxidase subunit 2